MNAKVTHLPGRGGPVQQQARPDLDPMIENLCNAMGAVSVMQAAHPSDVEIDQPDFHRACRAIYKTLDDVLTELNNLDDELDQQHGSGSAGSAGSEQ